MALVCGVWCVVCGVWCVVCGLWCVVCGVWCMVCGVWCVVCGVRCVVCGVVGVDHPQPRWMRDWGGTRRVGRGRADVGCVKAGCGGAVWGETARNGVVVQGSEVGSSV